MFPRMEFLTFTHSTGLVAMACVIAVVAGFTGLSLTRDLASRSVFEKKLSIALASIALGGGIWAMHFIAMLGLQLPILFYYDAAITLVSALTAILVVGGALILLHFTERTPAIITTAGAVIGVGILLMHYIGMAGLELCRAVYTPTGVALSSVVAIALCCLAIWIAYGQRTNRNILIGTLCFAVSVCSVHFLAMAGTNFIALPGATEFGPSMSNETLALGVIFFSFVMFGACLWVGVTYLLPAGKSAPSAVSPVSPVTPVAAAVPAAAPVAPPKPRVQVPCERDGSKVFLSPEEILYLRADGHYTQVQTATVKMFCAWPITEAKSRLEAVGFMQTHRSFMVNPAHVRRFERNKDKGRLLFGGGEIPPALVSRSKLKDVQTALAAQVGAIGAS